MTTAILTLNAGSSSLKLALYPPVGDVPRELVSSNLSCGYRKASIAG